MVGNGAKGHEKKGKRERERGMKAELTLGSGKLFDPNFHGGQNGEL